jgi:transposase
MGSENYRHYSRNRLLGLLAERDVQIGRLMERLAEQDRQMAALEAEVARLRKDSSNSSKPPSSDIVKPPKPPPPSGQGHRHIGGQPGHAKHERPPLPSERVDRVITYTQASCPRCGTLGRAVSGNVKVFQQVGLAEKPLTVTEYRRPPCRCPKCRLVFYPTLAPGVEEAGFFDARLTALVAWLKSRSHDSYSTVQEFLRDVGQLEVSRGFLAKVIARASASLGKPYAELLAALPHERRVNVDETGHPDRGAGLWTWVFRARRFSLFKIDPSRGSGVLEEVLGTEFRGLLGCDYFSAYRKYMGEHNILVQFCLAHLIRDVKFLLSLPDPVTRRYGERLLGALRRMFRVIHRRETLGPERFQRRLERAAEKVLAVGRRASDRIEARNLAERFRRHGRAYFRFITTPGVEPTNNLAEQALRFVVIDRRLTQGTRSASGRRWCERAWTAAVTCAQQGRSLFAYLCSAVDAHFANQLPPSLLTSGP